ncbi:MAG: imidazole glycerol phosphate synthase subunit HisH [Desulfovibrionaceae bacterium]|nr:imidazole glycerol phosphate synthase subunit HisH [Desulfovibrionaceae bacterium]MBF0513950.1 imidazole glycerol phosphate synthase subunit HisH [Desulfovibrionaceae bacterium]
MLAILEYNAGNQTSVRRALDHLGIACRITNDPALLASSLGIIFPGVGAAGQAMDELTRTGLGELLKRQVDEGKPLLGICVGCQILLDYSPENDTKALGVIPGECLMFHRALTDEDGAPIRVPHMGWNRLTREKPCEILDGVEPEAEFYFVHSYYPSPAPEYVLATTTYGARFCSLHGRPGLWAVQFHPEKSGRPGLKLLSNFYQYCRRTGHAQ